MKKIIDLYKKYSEYINYLIFGTLTVLVNLIVFFVLTKTIIDSKNPIELQLANIIAWIFAVIFAYITNRIFVFKSKDSKIFKEAAIFIISRLITLLIEIILSFFIVTIIGVNFKLGKIICQLITIILNYIISKLFIFKRRNK